MPGRDRTGPMGTGAMKGRGAGPCGGGGAGGPRRRGRGRGFGKGFGGGLGARAEPTFDELQSEAASLERALGDVKARIEGFEQAARKAPPSGGERP